VIISYGDREFRGGSHKSNTSSYNSLMSKVISSKNEKEVNESQTLIMSIVNIEDRSIVKVTFKSKPKGLQAKVTPDVT
jgi:hypothetical protein